MSVPTPPTLEEIAPATPVSLAEPMRETFREPPPRPADVPARAWPTQPVGRRIYITFGGEVYDGTTALITLLAPKFGADEVRVYDDRWLMEERADFHEQNRWLWDHPHKRGFGWYAWKPFILLDALERAQDGDVILYTDADTFPVDDFSVLYEQCARDGGILLFKAGGNVHRRFRQSQWCKRDCYIVMNQDHPRYYEAEAGVARFMLFQKGRWRAHQFLMEWLTYCVNPLATTFEPSRLAAEPDGFVEHRTEQAIMTNLAHKYRLKLYREACELGNAFPEDKDLYPQLFSQVNPWGNKTAPCVGSRFCNVAGPADRPVYTAEEARHAVQAAERQAAAGRHAAAETIVSTVIAQVPSAYRAAQLLGQLKEHRRDFTGAIAAYEKAIAASPGQGLAFTRRALLKLRLAAGNPPTPRAPGPRQPFIAMNQLGVNGRFGNQLLQYGVLRIYAERHGLEVLTPDWIGRDLFGFSDPLAGTLRPRGSVSEKALLDILAGRQPRPVTDVDVSGYFCGSPADWAGGRELFQSLFEPVAPMKRFLEAARGQIARPNQTLVALHLRRGDYGQGAFWVAPTEWYRAWLDEIWPTLANPVLYVATDEPALVAQFADFQPHSAADVGPPLPGVEFFTDHWMLRHADWIATSNSTFSGTAALLNRRSNAAFVRPDRAIGGLRRYDPWSEKVLLD